MEVKQNLLQFTAFLPESLKYFGKGRSSGLSGFCVLPVFQQWICACRNMLPFRGRVIGITAAGTAPDSHRIPYYGPSIIS